MKNIENLDKLNRKLQKMQKIDYHPLLTLVSRVVQDKAKSDGYVPVDTGDLRNSIVVAPPKNNEALVYTNLEYATAQEFGTTNIRGSHYMKRATLDSKTKVKELSEMYIKKQLQTFRI